MKSFVLFVFAFASVGVFSAPVEFPGVGHDWSLVPDGDGHLHLVDLNPIQIGDADFVDIEPAFNAESDVIFILFTQANPTNGQVIVLEDTASLANSHFNPNNPTRFIIHGWNNNGGSTVNVAIRSAYLQSRNINVIVVDWGAGAQTVNYVAARNRINAVGPVVARFIDHMHTITAAPFSSIAVVGHSLGGHASGIAGKHVTRGRLQTVVALDPALPLFSIDRPDERVTPDDAIYVEVIHTNAGLLGFDLPIGRASFYPNFGSSQPGCLVDITGNCAHSRAHEFFAESINTSVGFWGTRCASYDEILIEQCTSSGPRELMGGEPSAGTANGVYWLPTNRNSPFAQG